jgi:hypothetical protein
MHFSGTCGYVVFYAIQFCNKVICWERCVMLVKNYATNYVCRAFLSIHAPVQNPYEHGTELRRPDGHTLLTSVPSVVPRLYDLCVVPSALQQ